MSTSSRFWAIGYDNMTRHKQYARKHDDMPNVAGWRWSQQGKAADPAIRDTAGDNV